MTEKGQTVGDDKVVFFNYTLRDNEGNVLDQSDDEPMLYLHGAGNIVPGLEDQMNGKEVGDKFTARVAAKDAYGERSPAPPQKVPREAFPDRMPLQEGMPLVAETPDGQHMHFFIIEVGDEEVTVDSNHPLAGVDLEFEIEVVRIRDATEGELEHGHPHGPDGHAHHH